MNRNSLIFLFLLLLSCQQKKGCVTASKDFDEYQVLYPSYSFDTSCSNNTASSHKRSVYVSFSNSWGENVVVKKNGEIIFCDSIVTDKSTGITNKGFSLKDKFDRSDSIEVFLIESKKTFTVRFSYAYKYIKLYKINDKIAPKQNIRNPIRIKITNCTTLVY